MTVYLTARRISTRVRRPSFLLHMYLNMLLQIAFAVELLIAFLAGKLFVFVVNSGVSSHVADLRKGERTTGVCARIWLETVVDPLMFCKSRLLVEFSLAFIALMIGLFFMSG